MTVISDGVATDRILKVTRTIAHLSLKHLNILIFSECIRARTAPMSSPTTTGAHINLTATLTAQATWAAAYKFYHFTDMSSYSITNHMEIK